jgi:hypothetical protein
VQQADADHTEICVIAANSIRVQGAPSLHGKRPVVLIARHALIVDPGTVIDVATHKAGKSGAGAPGATCTAVNGGSNAPAGGGGGAGGAFQGPSARGGNAAGNGGAAPGAIALGGVRAGCPGGRGGNGTSSGGLGGTGGGALYLIAGERIEVAGVINASGEGGGGGNKPTSLGAGGGGGGGGSGGLIGLDAPLVTIGLGAVLVANGGGGGGGGSSFAAGAESGMVGADPLVFGGTFPFKASGGGGGGTSGGTGGDGAAATQPPRNGQDSVAGGGGAGGAVGYIVVYGETIDDTDAVFSPARGP